MLDTIFQIIVIVGVIYYIRTKTFWFQDLEKVFEKEAKELAEWARKDKESAEKWPSKAFKGSAKFSEEQLRRFVQTHDNYLHLKERYRHDGKSGYIHKDWVLYLKAIRDQLDCQMDYMMLNDDNLIAKTHDKDQKSRIVMEEIEKRFSKYLKEN